MRWSESQVAGFLLAAVAHADRGCQRALHGLHPANRTHIAAQAAQLAALPRATRRQRVTGLVERMRPELPGRRAASGDPHLHALLTRIARSMDGG